MGPVISVHRPAGYEYKHLKNYVLDEKFHINIESKGASITLN